MCRTAVWTRSAVVQAAFRHGWIKRLGVTVSLELLFLLSHTLAWQDDTVYLQPSLSSL